MTRPPTVLLTVLIGSLALRALACASSADDGGGARGADGVGADGSSPGADSPDGDVGDGATGDGATGDGGSIAPSTPPSYCQGLTFYVAYDQGVAATLGTATVRVIGEVGATSGHFGGAAAFVHDAGVDASMVFYDSVDGGAPFYEGAEGTVAFWFRANAPCTSSIFVRPLADASAYQPAGPLVSCQGSTSLEEDYQVRSVATLRFTSPFLRGNDFDQFVAAWRLSTDAGPGAAELVVNGGTGEVFHDAGYDAASLDGAVDDAGNYTLPYATRRSPKTFGESYGPFRSLRVGGTDETAPHGDIDELAVWNRMLTRAEMADLYRATVPLRAACHLP